MFKRTLSSLILITTLLSSALYAADRADEIIGLITANQLSNAEKALNDWQEQDPEAWQTGFFRAHLAFQRGEPDSAIALLQEMLDKHSHPEIYNNLAVYMASMGQHDKAQETLTQGLTADQRFSVLYQNLSQLFAFKASQAYQQALSMEKPPQPPQLATILKPTIETAKQALKESAKRPNTNKVSAKEPDAAEVVKILKNWAAAWSEQNVSGYLSVYSDNFTPLDGTEFKLWKAYRHNRLMKPSFIKVNVENINVNFLENNMYAHVHFVQHYRSDSFRETSYKFLVMRKEKNGWRIVIETTA